MKQSSIHSFLPPKEDTKQVPKAKVTIDLIETDTVSVKSGSTEKPEVSSKEEKKQMTKAQVTIDLIETDSVSVKSVSTENPEVPSLMSRKFSKVSASEDSVQISKNDKIAQQPLGIHFKKDVLPQVHAPGN